MQSTTRRLCMKYHGTARHCQWTCRKRLFHAQNIVRFLRNGCARVSYFEEIFANVKTFWVRSSAAIWNSVEKANASHREEPPKKKRFVFISWILIVDDNVTVPHYIKFHVPSFLALDQFSQAVWLSHRNSACPLKAIVTEKDSDLNV